MTTLNYIEFGKGRPVIILHGLFGSARNWQSIAKTLAENYRVITPDLRNHGLSPHVDNMSYPEMADDIIRLVNKLELNNVILVGHSMGGKVAMTACLLKPELLTGLIVIDIAPVTYKHDFLSLVEAMNELNLSNIKNRTDAEDELFRSTNNINLARFIVQNLVRTNEGFQWRINLKQITSCLEGLSTFPEALADHSCRLPSLFLGGADSNYVRSIHNEAIYKYFPAAEIKMLENAGHWLHVDKPEEFMKSITSFINCV